MISLVDQTNLFTSIAKRLDKKITIYAIGGTALMFLGLKANSLDIDLIFTNDKDRQAFKKAAESLGYGEMDAKVVYGDRSNKPILIKLDDARIDLFLLKVITSTFSKQMQKRSEDTIRQFNDNLIIKIADIHDLIIMKAVTGREKDELDILNIINNSKINWDLIINEAENQVNLGSERAILELGTTFENLTNKNKVVIPEYVLDKLWNLLNKQIDKNAKK